MIISDLYPFSVKFYVLLLVWYDTHIWGKHIFTVVKNLGRNVRSWGPSKICYILRGSHMHISSFASIQHCERTLWGSKSYSGRFNVSKNPSSFKSDNRVQFESVVNFGIFFYIFQSIQHESSELLRNGRKFATEIVVEKTNLDGDWKSSFR